MTKQSRRQFLRTTVAGTASAMVLPTIVPVSVLGANSPSNKIQVGQIGCGRIAHEMDLPGLLRQSGARVVALCDLDSRRLEITRERVDKHYAAKAGSQSSGSVKTYGDYRELLKEPDVDAVAISTPDHWHSEPVVAAALAGKAVYVQKPLSMTINEGRIVSDTLRAKRTAFQIGSQQRSDAPWPQFRRAVELVRNGRIGKLERVKIGLPTDPAGNEEPEMPVPPNLNYEMWLGPTPQMPYTEKRVHPQKSISERPGWLRIESYCLGMITGWGSHHVDIAHWGMDTEITGPVEAEATAKFPEKGIWNVHMSYHIEMKYANGVVMELDDKLPNGVRFEGTEGWVFVTRGGARVTASDPAMEGSSPFRVSDPKINAELEPNALRFHSSKDHHLDWLESIRSGKPAATTPEQAHRSTSACNIGWVAMKLGRKLKWDPVKEQFIGDEQANAMCSRPQRAPYGLENILKKA